MDADLHSLAYFSRNSIAAHDCDLEAEIARILAVARKNNQLAGVTGALLFSEGCFAQVLEGDLLQVGQIFERIECDPRHENVTILQFTPIQQRNFAGWSMAFAGMRPPQTARNIAGILRSADRIRSGDAGQDIVGVLHSLIGEHESGASPH